jgi:hypothetical protein
MAWNRNLPSDSCQYRALLLSTLLVIASVSAIAAPPLAVPIDGKPFPAELTAIGNDGMLLFTVADKLQKTAIPDLVAWGAPVEPRRGPVVVLADGGLLAADVLAADKDRLDADSETFGRLKLPLEFLAGVIFRLPGAVGERDQLLDRLASAAGDSDRLLLDNGDELSGTLDGIDEASAKLQTETGPANVNLGRISAVIFNPQLKGKRDEKSPRMWLGFRDGSRLLAKARTVATPPPIVDKNGTAVAEARVEDRLQCLVLGQTWTTARTNLVFLQPLAGRALYLSQLKPTDYRHVPYLGVAWPYKIDHNVQGGLLRAGGRLYLAGIGMHSAARLSYELPPDVKRFQAEAAIDDAAVEGSVRFRVFVDGKEKFASPPVRGGMPALPIDVDIDGGKRLDLVVDFADRADVQDYADWLDSRLILSLP